MTLSEVRVDGSEEIRRTHGLPRIGGRQGKIGGKVYVFWYLRLQVDHGCIILHLLAGDWKVEVVEKKEMKFQLIQLSEWETADLHEDIR